MNWHCRALLVALLTFLSSRTALAQRTYALGVGGGAAIPVGKLSNVQNTGYNGLVVLAVGSAELPIGVRFDGIYNNLVKNSVPEGSPAATSSDLRIIAGLFNLVFAFPGTSAKPYLLAGGGLYSIKSNVADTKAKNDFGFNAGAGITFGLGPFAAFLESRYHTISRNEADGGVIQFVPITVGLLF
jgi:opacity protein-like surface antigen